MYFNYFSNEDSFNFDLEDSFIEIRKLKNVIIKENN